MPSGHEALARLAQPQTRRYSRRSLARAAWLLLAGVNVALLFLLPPINLRTAELDWRFQAVYPVVARFLSRPAMAAILLALSYMVALLCLLVGAFIAWRKADDGVAWLAGAVLVTLPGMFGLGGRANWFYYPPPWRHIFTWTQLLLSIAICATGIVLFAFVFPNGRWPLRWTAWLCAGCIPPQLAALIMFTWSPSEAAFQAWLALFVTVPAVAIATQLYRYRHLSTPLERQQTK